MRFIPRTRDKFNCLTLTHALCLILLAAGYSFATTKKSDQFIRIVREPGGITAYDRKDSVWHYDFSADSFVLGPLPGEPGSAFAGDESGEAPVEERSVVEKSVEPLARFVSVEYDEFVNDDIIAFGRVTVRGWVKGNVQSTSRRVLVAETGRVDGNVTAPEVVVKEGGQVLGKITETGAPFDLEGVKSAFDFSGMFVVFGFTLSLLLSSFVIQALMSRQLSLFETCFSTYRLRSFGWGTAMILGLPVLCALLVVTIVGVFALPILPLAIVFAFFMGITVFARNIGARACHLLNIAKRERPTVQTIIGVLVFMSLWFVVATLLGAPGNVAEGFGVLFLVLAILLNTYILFVSVGSAFLTRFGTRAYASWHDTHRTRGESVAPAPAPPPIRDTSTKPSTAMLDGPDPLPDLPNYQGTRRLESDS